MPHTKFILITRPAEESRVFARKLRQEGFPALIEPMLEISQLDFKVPDMDDYQGLVFTSVNAVRGLAAKMKDKVQGIKCTIYCVGDRTAKEARAHGFEDVLSAKGSTDELLELVHQKVTEKSKPLLYVRGQHTAQPLEKMLRAMGYKVEAVTVYTAQAVRKLSPECITAIKDRRIAAITFFSKRTVDTFVREVKKNGLLQEFFAIKLLSLSDSMLESVRPYRQARTHTAATPDAPGMLRLLIKIYKKDR
jgi:uroporphyrinogen-III synthase